jgi:xanthine dehydrogenase accessory factor
VKIYERLWQMEREGGLAVLVTVIRAQGSVPRHEGSKMLVFPDGGTEGTVGGGEMERRVIEEALQAMDEGTTRVRTYEFRDPEQGDVGVCGGEIDVFIEPLRPRPTLVVVGGGHVGSATAKLASWLGFHVVVSDDRPEYATTEAVPDADAYVVGPLAELPDRIAINEDTYLVLTTRGILVDVAGLPALLETPAAYIGVIGSRRRWETAASQLLEMGVSREEIGRVVSPMGLEINAETPEEIAVSILAQIVMLRHGGSGEVMAHDPLAARNKAGT